MKKLVSVIILAAFMFSVATAQNESKKFAFGVGAAFIDFASLDMDSYYDSDNVNSLMGPVHFDFAYNVYKPINLVTSFNFGDIYEYNGKLHPISYWKWDAGIQIRPMNFIDDESWFDPYLTGNAGVLKLNDEYSPVIHGGLGINFWVHENVALNVQSGYNYGIDSDEYLETTFGIKIRIGKTSDRDGDGIIDSKDKCPDVPGVKSAGGCPDADGDGIADSEDKCPNKAGVAELNGCPKIDKAKKKELEEKLKFSAKHIQFDTGKSTITSSSNKDLDNVVALMKEYPTLKLSIEGHTDNTGNYDKNKALSQKRADAVKDYFVKKGISASRLTATGYGSDKPIDTNDTPEGRQNNRRVELIIVN